MDVLVVTVVHTPLDARIHRRQVSALLDAGHAVTYAAPLSGYGVGADELDPRIEVVDLPRARGRRRLTALRAARRLVRRLAGHVDVVVLHDPELLLAVVGHRGPVVWDVHEDLAGALADKAWLPSLLRGLVVRAVRLLERWAERRAHLLLAEEGYQDRFRKDHPVVPNLPPLPDAPRGASGLSLIHISEPTRPY